MIDLSHIDYSTFDNPEVLSCLFHPRQEPVSSHPENTYDMTIPVEDGLFIGARFHNKDKTAPVILYFHGNGEIVADYDDSGCFYLAKGINFLPVDYRGYGLSTGTPTVTSMMHDCYIILEFVKKWLSNNFFTGPLIVMGRSLGSASALELGAGCGDKIDGLIIESGFAHYLGLLRTLGIDVDAFGITEEAGATNIEKIKSFKKPLLIIHAEYDQIIPFSDGQALLNACSSLDKRLLKIPGANHNTIFAYGMDAYMKAVQDLAKAASRQSV